LGKRASVALLAACETAAMALWFSATAVVPSLTAEYPLTATEVSLFTSMVQVGFVAGTLLSALLGLADRLDPRRYFMAAALVAALANAAVLVLTPGSPAVYAARFVTGMCMAGVYPVGIKMAGTWAKGDLGMMVAVLVAATTMGSASPHLFNALGGIDWRFTIAVSSVAAALSAVAINLVTLGPALAPARAFSPRHLMLAFRTPSLRLANFGYLGHMWELYAMWAWLGVFLYASFQINSAGHDPALLARVVTFVAMGLGGVAGGLAAGWLADRHGRTAVTIGALAASGACALTVGLFFGGDPFWLSLVCLVWGATVIADSAQFSASTTELARPELIGTMLTVQTCAGFLLTLATIHLMPLLVDLLGWRHAFMPLALGPVFGVLAMARLRGLPEARRLAGGRR